MDALNVDKDLDLIICQKEKIPPSLAMKWKWRVLNEYPDTLKELVRAWASDNPLPEVKCNDISLDRILNTTPMGFIDAVDLLYILQVDPASGYEIFSRSIVRDFRRGR